MNLKKCVATLLLALTACTTFEDIDSGLNQFKGQPVNSLIEVLGFPDDERSIAGRRIIIWNTNENFTIQTPITSYGSGTLNTFGQGGYAYGNYQSRTTSYVPTNVNYNCTLLVEINRKNRILGHSIEGNIGGCERYASALKPFVPAE